MSTLTASPYNYVFDQTVLVRVYATNSYGNGLTSIANTVGAKIRRVPD